MDDIADDEQLTVADRRRLLTEWREDIRRACAGGTPILQPVNQELQPVISEFRLPFQHFDELIQSCELDLDVKRYPDETLLDTYCFRVASIVGLLSIEVFGYRDVRCREYAIHLGKALQITNILRDVGSDAARDRIYLPSDLLTRHQVTPEEILARQHSERFRRLADEMAAHTRSRFASAGQWLPKIDRRSMVAAEIMGGVYWSLLRKL